MSQKLEKAAPFLGATDPEPAYLTPFLSVSDISLQEEHPFARRFVSGFSDASAHNVVTRSPLTYTGMIRMIKIENNGEESE
ncbi:hypothetical protein NPIL_181861 [Nephila pilipes]|uniref:Uncharacterized protein n=1 Tax=Nephila pilipes TaxID=299642 RepID=A0A8X6PFT5_NEPPI|nr:hypothetical protein NPIL_181861 [Nephila pilipes]